MADDKIAANITIAFIFQSPFRVAGEETPGVGTDHRTGDEEAWDPSRRHSWLRKPCSESMWRSTGEGQRSAVGTTAGRTPFIGG
jgi:hypothetical protein